MTRFLVLNSDMSPFFSIYFELFPSAECKTSCLFVLPISELKMRKHTFFLVNRLKVGAFISQLQGKRTEIRPSNST